VPVFGNRQRPVPGPPKRFAQTVGLVFSSVALALYFAVGTTTGAKGVVGLLAVFAALEAGVGFCPGCFVFGYLMRWGLIPESACRSAWRYSNLSCMFSIATIVLYQDSARHLPRRPSEVTQLTYRHTTARSTRRRSSGSRGVIACGGATRQSMGSGVGLHLS